MKRKFKIKKFPKSEKIIHIFGLFCYWNMNLDNDIYLHVVSKHNKERSYKKLFGRIFRRIC